MASWIEELRRRSAWLPLLAIGGSVGCLSTSGDPLFSNDLPEQAAEPAVMPAAVVDAMVEVKAPVPVTRMIFVPEQLVGGGARDIAPAGGAAPAGGDAAAAEETSEPAEETSEPAEETSEPAEETSEPAEESAAAPDPCAQSGMIVCDGFEGQLDEGFPLDGGWLPELAGCGTHRVDGAGPTASGSKALRVDPGGYPECMLHAELSGEQEVFVRTRVFLGAQGTLLDQYISLLEFGSRPTQDDAELRIGLRPSLDSLCPGVPGIDVSGSGSSGAPVTECTGFVLETGRWYCIEGHFTRIGRDLSLSVAIDGTEVLTTDFEGADAWGGSELYLKIGRAAYGASGAGSLWHDDVAVSREPLPCQP